MNDFSNDQELQYAAQRCVDTYARICNETFVGCNIPIPVILNFDLVLEDPKCAGRAIGVGKVALNMVLYRDNVEEFLNTVIVHEVSHLCKHCVFDQNGVIDLTGHGAEWQFIMKKLGKNPVKFHKMDTTKAIAFYKEAKRKKKKEKKDAN